MSVTNEIQLGLADLAKYPFLRETKTYAHFFSVEDLGTDDFDKVREFAYRRIRYGIDVADDVTNILSFYTAIVILSLVNDRGLNQRFALNEATKVEKHLRNSDRDTQVLIFKIISELFGVQITIINEAYKIPVESYLQQSVQFNEPEWKLVNRLVHNGFVHLTERQAIRLIRRTLMTYIVGKISKINTDIPESLHDIIIELRLIAQQNQPKLVQPMRTPPCVEHCLQTLKDGENLSHSGRFLLGTFMLKAGWPIDEVVKMFKNAPDFSEKITRQKLESMIRDKQIYMPPSCSKLKSLGLCYRTDECGTIKNPIQFGIKRLN